MKKITKLKTALIAAASLFAASNSAAETIDVLVLYNDAAVNTTPGGDMPARVASMISYSNGAYENSGVDMELRLVGLERYNPSYGTAVDGGSLDSLRNDQAVANFRQEVGADLVTFIMPRTETSGGFFTCGIGYVPSGQNGQFYSNASSLGYNIVGSNCGLSTFTHELGHNMGLNHSPKQDGGSGLWNWARGYGVEGEFVTTMAYGFVYNTRNQIQVMSNPNVSICDGFRCGSARGNSDQSDASEALNRVASQIANFVPTTVGDEGGNNGGDDGGSSDLPACADKNVNNNLLANSNFTNGVSGWTQILDASAISGASVNTSDCKDSVLLVSDRTQSYGNATYPLQDQLDNGAEYRVRADAALLGTNERDDLKVAIQINSVNGTSYQYLSTLSITGSGYSAYDDSFTLEADAAIESTALIFYGPVAGTQFILDDVSLVKVANAPAPVESTGFSEGFEGEISNWIGNAGSDIARSSTAYSGSSSLVTTGRDYWYSGPAKQATGLILPNTNYSFSFAAGFTGTNSSQPVRAYVYYVDSEGGKWQKVSDVDTPASRWTTYSGNFSFNPVGAVSQVRFHVMGPEAGLTLYVDDVVVQ